MFPRIAIVLMLALSSLRAQPPQFEVASVKSVPREFDPAACTGSGPTPGRLTMKCRTVQAIVQSAYGVLGNRVSGGPPWVDSDRFTIEAKAAGNPSAEMMAGPMLQRLLEDRFKLKVHREMRERPLYALTVAKGGLKLQASKETCTPPENVCGQTRMQFMKGLVTVYDLHAMSMAEFASALSPRMDRTVIDKTGAEGIYDFHLEFALDETTPGFLIPRGVLPPEADPTGGPSIFTAIQQLGLKLESVKGPVEFIIIDHVEKPTEN